MSLDFRRHVSQMAWPQVPDPWACGVLSVLYQLNQTQYWPVEDVRAHQWKQLSLILTHAAETTKFYPALYAEAGIDMARLSGAADLSALPVVDRATLQQAGADWHSSSPPRDHGGLFHYFTSGSTGRPLHSSGTALTHLMRTALVLRLHEWARRDTRQKFAFVQKIEGQGTRSRHASHWEKATRNILETGPALVIDIDMPVADQIAMIADYEPAYLTSYPSVIAALARHCLDRGISFPSLRQIGSYGEILEAGCRDLARRAWGLPIYDSYSAKEAGAIALQCPDHDHYHVQSEAMIVEILDENGRECPPGQPGRLVLTTLHNFAAPLIRYAIGDHAIWGPPCSCGRTLPVIERVLGRQRNMLRYPDGSERWPTLGESDLVTLAAAGLPAIQQFQVVQHSPEWLEARLVTPRPLDAAEEDVAAAYLRAQLGAHWQIRFNYPSTIERGPGGKFEDFMSLC